MVAAADAIVTFHLSAPAGVPLSHVFSAIDEKFVGALHDASRVHTGRGGVGETTSLDTVYGWAEDDTTQCLFVAFDGIDGMTGTLAFHGFGEPGPRFQGRRVDVIVNGAVVDGGRSLRAAAEQLAQPLGSRQTSLTAPRPGWQRPVLPTRPENTAALCRIDDRIVDELLIDYEADVVLLGPGLSAAVVGAAGSTTEADGWLTPSPSSFGHAWPTVDRVRRYLRPMFGDRSLTWGELEREFAAARPPDR